MKDAEQFLFQQQQLTRRHFIRLGATGAAGLGFWPLAASADPTAPELANALRSLEPYLTPQNEFRDVSRGKPLPHSLPEEEKRKVGLTRESWKLEVISDPEHPATLRRPLAH